ncbi:MAG: hypothetical protein JJT76_08170 [Clostridiaceae bacterium]|nr:hypothetical protein [Clostridiaceae bacterium]
MINIKRKIILFIIVTSLLVVLIAYSRPIQVNELIYPYTNKIFPDKISSYTYFPSSDKELEITGQESIKEMVTLLGNMEVRRTFNSLNSWTPKLKNTYKLVFYGEDNKILRIDILNDKYIKINHHSYKIIGTPDIERIYEIIILDQHKGILDEFYYELIEKD